MANYVMFGNFSFALELLFDYILFSDEDALSGLEFQMVDKEFSKSFTAEEISMLNDAMQLAIASAQRLANRAGQPAAVVEQYKAHKVRLAALAGKLVLTK